MPTQKVQREEIVRRAEKLFKVRGYHRTSMQEVAQAAGILKGSLYYHFEGKEALMAEVLRMGHRKFAEDILVHAWNDATPRERMQTIFELIQREHLSDEGGCIMGNIGLETSSTMPAFREIIESFFSDWMEAFTVIFWDRYPRQEARRRAERSVEELEGAILLCRVFRDSGYIERALRRVLEQL